MTAEPPGDVRALTALSAEEELFRQTVRDFAERRIRPLVASMDREARFAPGLIDELFPLGLMGIEVPTSYGGAGASFFMSLLAIEELARVDPAVAVCVDVQNTIVTKALMRWGDDAQRGRFLTDLCRATVGAFALSEAGSGSDAFALTTHAVRDGDVWRLSGRKLWITNALEAGLFLVFATVDPARAHRGITAFLVERGAPGLTIGRKEDKLGIRASSTCELIFDDCVVPTGNVLGPVGEGYKIAIETLNEGRIGIGAQLVGLATGALELALAYAQERRQFGQAIAAFQGVQFQLAELATLTESARLMVYNAARLRDAGRPFLELAAMAKYVSSQVAERVASRAVEIFGG